jgi:putative membrane protein
MKLLRYLSWIFRAVLFLMLLLFALKNTEPVTLRFFFGESWQVPLVLLLLIFFAFGAVLGVLAGVTRVLQHRREILALKRERATAGKSPPAEAHGSVPPPAAEG